MSQEPSNPQVSAWLQLLTGPEAGRKHPLNEKNLLGRGVDNDVPFVDPSQGMVSGRHAEIVVRQGRCRLRDLGSTNGTLVDGKPVDEIDLRPGMVIELGRGGPRMAFGWGNPATAAAVSAADETIVVGPATPAPEVNSGSGDELLMAAVEKARRARAESGSGQTMMIMREVVSGVVGRSKRRLKLVIAALVLLLIVVSSYSFFRIHQLSQEKDQVDDRIAEIELELTSVQEPQQVEVLMTDLERLQDHAEEIRKNLLYRLGGRNEQEDFVDEQIHTLMSELGAPQYSIPPKFRERVTFHIGRYQGPDRSNVERALVHRRDELETMREEFRGAKLPADLALMALVESAFRWDRSSHAGAAGPWQFVPRTARAFGLQVDEQTDERFDVEKSTQAASKYLKQLILDFGSGQSVLLALAAYNLGPARVRREIRKVDDPIRQRDFWYLYRSRALPPETREYIPKIIAAILVARNPEQFGFEHEGLS